MHVEAYIAKENRPHYEGYDWYGVRFDGESPPTRSALYLRLHNRVRIQSTRYGASPPHS